MSRFTKKDKDGKFPAGTVNYLAYEKLKKYAKICEKQLNEKNISFDNKGSIIIDSLFY